MNKQTLTVFGAGLLLGAALVWQFARRVDTRIQVQEKIVTQNDVKTITRTVERPDGTKETLQTVVYRSQQASTTKVDVQKAKRPDWLVGVSAGSQLSHLGLTYGASVDRRVIGPVFAGVYGRTDGEFGLNVRLEF